METEAPSVIVKSIFGDMDVSFTGPDFAAVKAGHDNSEPLTCHGIRYKCSIGVKRDGNDWRVSGARVERASGNAPATDKATLAILAESVNVVRHLATQSPHMVRWAQIHDIAMQEKAMEREVRKAEETLAFWRQVLQDRALERKTMEEDDMVCALPLWKVCQPAMFPRGKRPADMQGTLYRARSAEAAIRLEIAERTGHSRHKTYELKDFVAVRVKG